MALPAEERERFLSETHEVDGKEMCGRPLRPDMPEEEQRGV